MVLEPKDYRKNEIEVYSSNGEKIARYSGQIYIYFGENKEQCFHFVDDEGHHHRIYGNYTIVVDEI